MANTGFGQNTFSFRAAKVWNVLPDHMTCDRSLLSFKTSISSLFGKLQWRSICSVFYTYIFNQIKLYIYTYTIFGGNGTVYTIFGVMGQFQHKARFFTFILFSQWPPVEIIH